jgi:hypothetical protein
MKFSFFVFATLQGIPKNVSCMSGETPHTHTRVLSIGIFRLMLINSSLYVRKLIKFMTRAFFWL